MRFLALLMVLLTFPLGAIPFDQIESPVPSGTWFADTAKLLKPESKRTLDAEIDQLEQINGTQIAVVTVKNTSGMDPKAYATRLFNHWGVGQAEHNNGVLILLVLEARRIEIELGDGANRYLTDAKCTQILQSEVVPEFKKGDYNRGVVKAVRGVIKTLKPVDYNAPSAQTVSSGPSRVTRPNRPVMNYQAEGEFPWTAAGVGGVLLAFGTWALRRVLRNRPPNCHQCKTAMFRLGEKSEDEYLEPGQRTEEILGSVDYDVWLCSTCDQHLVKDYAAWFSSFSSCPSCGYKALSSTTTTITAPTRYSTGQGRRDDHCRHCQHRDSSYFTISKLPEPSSSSSSSSSSSGFGGGRSSGGGGGASW